MISFSIFCISIFLFCVCIDLFNKSLFKPLKRHLLIVKKSFQDTEHVEVLIINLSKNKYFIISLIKCIKNLIKSNIKSNQCWSPSLKNPKRGFERFSALSGRLNGVLSKL